MNSSSFRTIVLLPILALAGCAAQYDCYPCERVSCSYCPLKPMAYTDYPSYNCNDSIGSLYLARLQAKSFVPEASVVRSDAYYRADEPAFEAAPQYDSPVKTPAGQPKTVLQPDRGP